MHKAKKPFVDFRAIRAQVTMEQVLDHYGVLDTFKRNGNRLSGPCPIHGGSNPTQFRVDTDKNLWNCFSECKNGGNVLDFIARKEDVSIHAAAIKAVQRALSMVSTKKAQNSWLASRLNGVRAPTRNIPCNPRSRFTSNTRCSFRLSWSLWKIPAPVLAPSDSFGKKNWPRASISVIRSAGR